MKNFVFVSPNFPETYWRFCRGLKDNGFNVLGIGDAPYYELSEPLKKSLTEYYKVSSLENYDEVFRAVAFFTFRYGKIDWLESNNEYWLERDAALRTEFNIQTGFQNKDMPKVKFKSKMKAYFKKAGIKVAKHCMASTLPVCKRLINQVGYPVIVKPDNGVGANATYKINNEQELRQFLKNKLDIPYIMEEYIEGEVNSYDAIVNSKGEPIFETGNVTPYSLMDIVNNSGDSVFYIVNSPFDDVRAAGRKVLKAFGVKSRFVHFEFFRLTKDQRIGKKGDIVALEVNMRPSGGISPDMMNFANSTDVYKIWADMVAFDSTLKDCGERYYCVFVGRREGKSYKYCEQDIVYKYGANIKFLGKVAKALSGAMGDIMFVANFKEKADMDAFVADVIAPQE